MKHLRITVGALLLALFASLASVAPALATVDGGVCTSSDTGGTGCTFTQLKPNLNEEVNNLNGRAKLLLSSVTGTNTITACSTPAVTSYVSGQPFELKPAAANTSSVTLNVCSIGAKALTDSAGNALTSGNLQSTTIYNVVYFAANDQFRVLSPLSGSGVGLTSIDIDTSSELDAIVTDDTGSGALVFATSPTLVTPALGTPASGTLTNATGLPIATGVSGLGTGVATALATPSSANLATALTDETGTGAAVFGTTPTFTTSMVAMGDTISDFTGFGMALSSGSLGLLTTGALDGECLAYESTGPTIDWVTCGGGGGGSLSDGDYGDITVSGTGTAMDVDFGATISGASNISQTHESTDAGGAWGPRVVLNRNSASPAASDQIGAVFFKGNTASFSDIEYAHLWAEIVDTTDNLQDGRLVLSTMVNNTRTTSLRAENASVAIGTLAVQGSASVNASNYFDDNVNINTLYQGIDSDLTALAGTASTGLYAITGTGTSAVRTLTAPAAGITVSNGNGVSGNPTLALADDLAAYEGLAANGMVARTGTGTASARTITGTSNEITVTNGDGVSGNPTFSLPSAITLTGKTVTGLTSASGGITVNGATSGSTVITATGVASGTLTLPAATDTLVGKATTDTLTNKTFDTAGTGNSLSIAGVAVTANTGTGAVVRATSPTLTTPALGTPSAAVLTNATGLPTAGLVDDAVTQAKVGDDAIGIDQVDLIDGDTPANGDCLTYISGGTGGSIEAVTCPGSSGGDDVTVNAGAVSNPDLNDTTPAAPTLGKNVYWQASGGSVSAYVKPGDWRTVVALVSDYNTSSTTLSAVTGMTCAMDASATYEVTVIGTFQSAAATTGIGMALDIPSGDVVGTAQAILAAATASFSHQNADNAVIGVTTGVPVANTNYPVIGKWLVSTAGTSGTMQLQYRAEVAASTTLKAAASGVAGTVMTCERII